MWRLTQFVSVMTFAANSALILGLLMKIGVIPLWFIAVLLFLVVVAVALTTAPGREAVARMFGTKEAVVCCNCILTIVGILVGGLAAL